VHPTDVLITDLDEDGWPEVVAVNQESRDLTVFHNDGSGVLSPGVATELTGRSRPWDLCAGDFDGDGHRDVAVASVGTHDVLVLRGLGDGTWSTGERVFPSNKDPRPIFCRDIDGDGRTDVVYPNRNTGRVDMILTGP
jgi:hypothetical protein